MDVFMVLLLTRMKLQQYLPNLTPPPLQRPLATPSGWSRTPRGHHSSRWLLQLNAIPRKLYNALWGSNSVAVDGMGQPISILPTRTKRKRASMRVHVRWPFARGSCTADAPGQSEEPAQAMNRMEATCCKASCRRKFRSQTSDNMDRWKAEQGRGREKRKIRRKKSRRERVRRKKMQMREKVGKSRNTVFFQWFVAPEGQKVGSLKRRVRSQLARWEDEKLHAVVARSTFRSQNVQDTPLSDHFWKLRCRKSARRCGAKHIRSQNAQNTPGPDHFWQLRCRKSSRRCGAKHISKSKCTKH